MPIYTCTKCSQQFKQKSDYTRHVNKKYPCITQKDLDDKMKNLDDQNKIEKDIDALSNTKKTIIIVKENDDKTQINFDKTKETIQQIEILKKEDLLYDKELKRIQDELKDELYLYVFNKLETNIKFKKYYEDTVNKIFMKFTLMCQRKLIKVGGKEEYKREYELFDDKKKIKSNEAIKNTIMDIFKDNEKYFKKRLLKYARNVAIEIYDVEYIDLCD